jgi:hypothetical protein
MGGFVPVIFHRQRVSGAKSYHLFSVITTGKRRVSRQECERLRPKL